MSFKFGKSSKAKLDDDLHYDMVRLCYRALELSKYDFGITETKRSLAKQKENVKNGDSWSLDSMHLVQPDGLVYAIDFAVYVGGKITWEVGYYRKVMQAFVTAAIEMKIQVEFGGLWRTTFDGPHVMLNRKYY